MKLTRDLIRYAASASSSDRLANRHILTIINVPFGGSTLETTVCALCGAPDPDYARMHGLKVALVK